jgi:hypothetical protein
MASPVLGVVVEAVADLETEVMADRTKSVKRNFQMTRRLRRAMGFLSSTLMAMDSCEALITTTLARGPIRLFQEP